MAISPAQARRARNGAVDETEIMRMRERVDRALASRQPTIDGVWYVSVIDVPVVVVDVLRGEYEAAGWDTEMIHDREGRALTLREKGQAGS